MANIPPESVSFGAAGEFGSRIYEMPTQDAQNLSDSIRSAFGLPPTQLNSLPSLNSLEETGLAGMPHAEDLWVATVARETGMTLLDQGSGTTEFALAADTIAGMVCARLDCDKNVLSDTFVAKLASDDIPGALDKHCEAFSKGYDLASQNPSQQLLELLRQTEFKDVVDWNSWPNDNLQEMFAGQESSANVSFTGGIGVCGMDYLNACTSITTEVNQDGSYSELSEYNA
jgi:hypothetical protein